MKFMTWLRRCWHGGSRASQWDGNKLNSRKFFVVSAVAVIVTTTCYVLVARLQVYESGIVVAALDTLKAVAIGYFGCNVLEHGLRVYEKVKNGGGRPPGGDVQ
ncbi:MAG: hypothetical protein JXA57_17735 [Armatimonadetes bacterium]|nr:hypothetical protein [Armatimonadota bacterium]